MSVLQRARSRFSDAAADPESVSRQFFLVTVLGGLSLVITWVVTVTLTEVVGLDERISYPIALVTSSTVNFFTVRTYVFTMGDGSLLHQAARFGLSIVGFRIAELALFTAAVSAGAHYQIALVVISLASYAAKFFVAKFLVFGSRAPRVGGEGGGPDLGA